MLKGDLIARFDRSRRTVRLGVGVRLTRSGVRELDRKLELFILVRPAAFDRLTDQQTAVYHPRVNDPRFMVASIGNGAGRFPVRPGCRVSLGRIIGLGDGVDCTLGNSINDGGFPMLQ
ncbi:hypothetical protein D1872_220210 [compost metagenome]